MTELQTGFFKETGIEAVNSQGEFDVDYVQWLEAKIIFKSHIETKSVCCFHSCNAEAIADGRGCKEHDSLIVR